MTTKEQEEAIAAWDKIAPGYDSTNSQTQMWLGNEGLGRGGLRTGGRGPAKQTNPFHISVGMK